MTPAASPTGQRIAADYHAVTVAGGWYGPALAEVLAGLPPDRSRLAPVPGMNTAVALLQHLLLWNERTRLALAGQPMPPWDAESEWSQPPAAWPDLLARWSRSRDGLESALRSFPEVSLAQIVPGRDYPFAVLLPGIVQHTIWHAGQLAMLRSALRATG